MTNKAVDRIRWKGRRKTAPLPDEQNLIDASKNETTRLDQTDQIMSLISGLSTEHRTVISLRYAEELSISEIANTLGLKQGTVKSRLHYALQAIRQKLDR